MKKYILTNETRKVAMDEKTSKTLYRIKALKDFGIVHEGDLGGYIEGEKNLSQNGNCWVDENAMVFDKAHISDNAYIGGEAIVAGNAQVFGDARVFEQATVFDNVNISDKAWIYGRAIVYDRATVRDRAEIADEAAIYKNAYVGGNAKIFGDAQVSGSASIIGNVEIFGKACVCGDLLVSGNARISEEATLKKPSDYISIDLIGSNEDCVTFFKNASNHISVQCDWFAGTIKGFELAVLKNCTAADKDIYKKAIELANLSIQTSIYYDD